MFPVYCGREVAGMDPEERDELLRQVDEELDDTPKGRAIKEIVKSLPVTGDDDAPPRSPNPPNPQG
jgi:hypothetical protein